MNLENALLNTFRICQSNLLMISLEVHNRSSCFIELCDFPKQKIGTCTIFTIISISYEDYLLVYVHD